jgi:hypothetical protein
MLNSYRFKVNDNNNLCVFTFPTDGGLGCVLMVYGLNPERMNCDRLFNLFCLYGNVIKVTRLSLLETLRF